MELMRFRDTFSSVFSVGFDLSDDVPISVSQCVVAVLTVIGE
jgi:hypothetical protein